MLTLGERADRSYVVRAADLLLSFNGRTIQPAFDETHGQYKRNPTTNRWEYSTYKVHHPEGADLVPLYWIVSGRRRDFTLRPDGVFSSSRQPIREQTGRWERFPKLWDQSPREVLELLGRSTVTPILDFALRVYQDNPDFSAEMTPQDVLNWLGQSYKPLRKILIELLANRPDLVTEDVSYAVITHPKRKLREMLSHQMKLSFAAVFSRMLAETDAERFHRAYEWSATYYALEYSQLAYEELESLTKHPLESANMLAAGLLPYVDPLPYQLILNLMTSEYAEVRAAGIQLFGELPLKDLYANHRETLAAMIVSDREEVRDTALPIVRRLGDRYGDFARELTERLSGFLRMRGKATDVHTTIAELLTATPFAEHLEVLDDETVWKLLRSRKYPAQEVGFAALSRRVPEAGFETATLVELGRHDLLDVRAFAREQFTRQADRTVYDVLDFIRLLDTDWTDSSDFAKDFLRQRLRDRDWTPEVLIHLVDIPREDVQQFALEFIEKHVKPEDATDFLLRASQHPGRHVQAFAAGWLDRYASDRPEVIEELGSFFRTLLSQVSRGRLAKDRVFDFLERESLASEPTARLTIPLLERIMLTIAVGDRARCLTILNALRRKYPHLDTPLEALTTPLSLTPKP